MKQIWTSLDDKTYEELEAYVKSIGLSKSNFIRMIIIQTLKATNQAQKKSDNA